MLLGPGCLVFTLVLPVLESRHRFGFDAVNRMILGRVAQALRPLVSGIAVCGTSDLVTGGRKVSGNSQRWLRRSFMHHGTLLYGFAISHVSRYLKMPRRQPEYRCGRSHEEFLTNLPIDRGRLRDMLVDAFGAHRIGFGGPPVDRVANLVRTKYGKDSSEGHPTG